MWGELGLERWLKADPKRMREDIQGAWTEKRTHPQSILSTSISSFINASFSSVWAIYFCITNTLHFGRGRWSSFCALCTDAAGQEVRRGTVGLGRLGPEEAHLRRLLHSRAWHLARMAEGQAPLGPLIWRPPWSSSNTVASGHQMPYPRAPIFRKEQSGGQRRWHKALSDSLENHSVAPTIPQRSGQSQARRAQGEGCQKIGGHVLKLPPSKARSPETCRLPLL